MSNLIPRRPDYNAPSKSSRAQRYPGAVLKRLRQERKGEDTRTAKARASREPWWPRVIHPDPVFSCGFWVWQIRP